MTPDQQAKIDKALANTSMSEKISGASAVSTTPGKAVDLSPQKTVEQIGADLHRAGVTMDK